MRETAVAHAEVVVGVSPKEAFRIFTEEISAWWRKDTPMWIDPGRGLAYRFEPGVNGRLLETYDPGGSDAYEIGRITSWQPGVLLAFTWRMPNWNDGEVSEVTVAFKADNGGTRVQLTHSFEKAGEQRPRASGYGGGWMTLLGYFADHSGK